MNKVILFGNTGKDPEVKRLESGKVVAKFSLATNKKYTNQAGEKVTETQWHNIVLWGNLAELAEKYVKKGNSLIIEGEIIYRTYTDKEGITKYMTEINGNGMHFVGNKKDEETPKEAPKEEWRGKQHVDSMSDINDLPGHIDDGTIPETDDLPY